MKQRIMQRLILILFMPVTVYAVDWQLGDLYSNQVLKEWQGKYPNNIQWNFDNLVLGKLTPRERQRLGHVALNFPLRAEGDLRNHPIQFYATDHTINLPILSIRFFDEITQAWGYLLSNGYNMQLVADYLAMIRYRNPSDFPGGRFPPPLEALGIPEDAWKHDKKMDDISQKALKSAIVWILAHETAHIYYQHPGYGPGVSRQDAQKNEAQADQFANMIMRRIGVAPVGMVEYFMTMAYMEPGRGDFINDKAWQQYLKKEATHPLTSQRLTAMARELQQSPQDFTSEEVDQKTAVKRIKYISEQITNIGSILDDQNLHKLVVVIGLSTDLQSLRTRKRVIPSAQQSGICVKTADTEMFNGLYTGIYIHYLKNGEKEWLNGNIQLKRNRNRITGRFNFGAGEGSLQGHLIQGKRLLYDWQWGNSNGRGTLIVNESGGLTGNWGYEQSDKDGGQWQVCLDSNE